MNEEEKKAIEYWKHYMSILHWNAQLSSEYYMKILLDLIEKQNNRLEQDERIIKEMAEYIEYVSSDGDKDVMYAELYNCNQLDRDWTRGKEAEIKDILEYFRKKCE